MSDASAAGLAVALAAVLGEPVDIQGLRTLTGGASRETSELTANGTPLILRRDPPNRAGAADGMRLEADAMRACLRAGLRVPEVLLHDGGALLETAGLVMRRIEGETIPRRILRDDAYAGARGALVADLGRFAAGLHGLDPAEIPGLAAQDQLTRTWEMYERVGGASPVFERTQQWLVDHRPAAGPPVVVHGDLRLGNLIVGPTGLAAVIDWELVHLGDPLEDLAWLCLKAWRFGEPAEVGGLGSVAELIAAYESAGGRAVDRASLHWWLVQRTLHWGVGCLAQAEHHLSGRMRSVELAVVGRRAAEQEWDLVELLAPVAWRSARAAPPAPPLDVATPYGRPTAQELVGAVREQLQEQADDGSYRSRVAANALAIVERELTRVRVPREGQDWDTLALDVRDRLAVVNPRRLLQDAR